jgi:hypothetical protein
LFYLLVNSIHIPLHNGKVKGEIFPLLFGAHYPFFKIDNPSF